MKHFSCFSIIIALLLSGVTQAQIIPSANPKADSVAFAKVRSKSQPSGAILTPASASMPPMVLFFQKNDKVCECYPAGGRPVSVRKLKKGLDADRLSILQRKGGPMRPPCRMGKLTASRRYNRRTFAAVKPWRVRRELAV